MLDQEFKWGRLLALGALALVVAACAPLASFAGGSPPAGSEARETISVNGVGEARGDPDMATITVGVNVADESISAAVSESNQIVDDITAALQEFGVDPDDIQTTNFSIWAEEQWDPETGQRREEKLYRVDSTVQVNLRQVERMGALMQTAIESGANNIHGLSYGVDDTSVLADEARDQAIADARRRAELIADELGVSLGEAVTVTESSGPAPMAFFETAMMGMGGGAGEPPLSQGKMTVTVSLNITYEILH